MALSIRPKFTREELTKMMQQRRDNLGKAIFFRFQRIGETFVTNARLQGTYKDHTGNLRSSIGYVILKDGLQVDQNLKTFPSVSPAKPKAAVVNHRNLQPDSGFSQKADSGLVPDEGAQQKVLDGQLEAKKVLDEVAARFPVGYVLIVVAGMEYAAAVESRHFDVITGSSLIAEQDLKVAIETLQNKVSAI
jgi:hypothetical protein